MASGPGARGMGPSGDGGSSLPAPPPAGLPPRAKGPASGAYTTIPRGPTSREQLKIAWQYPTYVEKRGAAQGETSAQQARHALTSAQAFAFLAGDDRRPLLVLRECLSCNGTDDALMNRDEDNERTLLMSRWFHCVKLPPDVLSEDQPFHALFAGENPGHLFVARWDGSGRKDLSGQQSRSELWGLLDGFLDAEYQGSCDGALKGLRALLDRFDRTDDELDAVQERIDALIEKGQADSAKARQLRAEQAELESARAEARAAALKLSDCKLRPASPPSESAPGGVR